MRTTAWVTLRSGSPGWRGLAIVAALAGWGAGVGRAWGAGGAPPRGTPPELTTHAERTGFRETGRYEEVGRICAALAKRHAGRARCVTVGETPEGRAIRAIVASDSGALTAAAARARGVPVLYVQGGLHAGEIDGKDAGLIALREILDGAVAPGLLRGLVLVFTPVFNVDGHERRGRFQRPNQEGPAEQGARTTSQRINLNRDYMIAEAPEMRAMLRFLGEWDPLVHVDLHVTDGGRFAHDVSVTTAPVRYGAPEVMAEARALEERVVAALAAAGQRPIDFYPLLVDGLDPSQGFEEEVDPPRMSSVYWGLRNRVGVLVEDQAWRGYGSRVATCRATIVAIAQAVVERREALRAAAVAADRSGPTLAGQEETLQWDLAKDGSGPVPAPRLIDVGGFAYERVADAPVLGGPGIVYDVERPVVWRVPLHEAVRAAPGSTVRLPRGGYVVPAAYAAAVGARLALHGITFRRIDRALPDEAVEVMRVHEDDVSYRAFSYQGRQMVRVEGAWRAERRGIESGSLFVPIAQARARLVAHLLEPAGPDSLSSWGLFNAAYEESDWIADHRALELARWMFDGDPRVAALFGDEVAAGLPAARREFLERLARDPGFAGDQRARLTFWLDRLPPQDVGLNQYPVLRTERAIEGRAPSEGRAGAGAR